MLQEKQSRKALSWCEGSPLHRSGGEGRSPDTDPQLHHSETVWPWASLLPSLCTPIVTITAGLWLPHARLSFGLHIAFSSACPCLLSCIS